MFFNIKKELLAVGFEPTPSEEDYDLNVAPLTTRPS